MAINTSLKKMPTGDGNPTAGAINESDFPTEHRCGNSFEVLRDAFALRGHTLHRTDANDAPVTYWIERWGLVRHLPTLHDTAMLLVRIRGAL